MRFRACSAVVVIASTFMAGCFGGGTGPDDTDTSEASGGPVLTLVEDAAGDARVPLGSYARETFVNPCWMVLPPREYCEQYVWPATDPAWDLVPEDASLEASAAEDILAVSFQERADAFDLEFKVSGILPGFAGLGENGGPEDGVVHQWWACWQVEANASQADQCASFRVQAMNDVLITEAVLEEAIRDGEACNEWSWCVWGLPFEVSYGTPGSIRMTVPRDLVPGSQAGGAISNVSIFTDRYDTRQAIDAGATGTYNGNHIDFRPWDNNFGYVIDEGGHVPEVRFGRPGAAWARPEGALVGPDAVGEIRHADLDILRIELAETKSILTLAMQLARVDAAPRDHGFYWTLGLPSRRNPDIGMDIKNGQATTWGGMCDGPDLACDTYRSFDVEVDRRVGSPGWVNLTVDRSDLGAPVAGGLLSIVFGSVGEPRQQRGEDAGAEWTLRAPGVVDTVWVVEPYWLHVDSAGLSLP